MTFYTSAGEHTFSRAPQLTTVAGSQLCLPASRYWPAVWTTTVEIIRPTEPLRDLTRQAMLG